MHPSAPHATTAAVVFDDGLGELAPMRDLRPVFDVRTGVFTTLERMVRVLGVRIAALAVPPDLEPLAGEMHGVASLGARETLANAHESVLLLNGRCVMPPAGVTGLPEGHALIEKATGDVIAACLPPPSAVALFDAIYRGGPPPHLERTEVDGRVLVTRPWHVRSARDIAIELDLKLLEAEVPNLVAPPPGVTLIGRWPPRVRDGAHLSPTCVIDTSPGTVVIEDGAAIRPGAYVEGPVYVGAGSTVREHAVIRGQTVLGPMCKVAGEIGGTIFQGHANKGHEGYIGDSWLGEWVNLGAGTTTSNLLSTYGEVKSAPGPDANREPTGEMFLGVVLADHVKTAIGSRLMTGAIAHTGVLWSDPGPMRGCIDRFIFASPDGVERYRVEKFLETMRTAMARRGIEPGRAYTDRVRALAQARGGG